nr:anion permease [Corynebacterium aquatimens]
MSFVDWMLMAVPFMLVVLAFAWVFLCLVFIPAETRISIEMRSKWNTATDAKLFYAVAGLTILLWMSEPLHGISSNTVGFIPVVALLCLQVMRGKDAQALDWPVLWLVSGGIALGTGVGASGLDEWLVGSVSWEVMGALAILAVLSLIGFGMANVIRTLRPPTCCSHWRSRWRSPSTASTRSWLPRWWRSPARWACRCQSPLRRTRLRTPPRRSPFRRWR